MSDVWIYLISMITMLAGLWAGLRWDSWRKGRW